MDGVLPTLVIPVKPFQCGGSGVLLLSSIIFHRLLPALDPRAPVSEFLEAVHF